MREVRYCGAKRTSQDGTTCRHEAGWGTTHPGWGRCRKHGGCTPNGTLAAIREEAEHRLVVAGRPVHSDPVASIQECIDLARGEVWYWTKRIAELTDDDAVGSVITTTDRSGGEGGGYSETKAGPPAVHIYVRERRNAMNMVERFSKTLLDAGIDERNTQLSERYGDQLGQLLVRLFGDPELALTAPQRAQLPTLLRRHGLTEGDVIEGQVA